MIAPEAGLSVSRQCTLLGVARSSFYYRPRPASAEKLELLAKPEPALAKAGVWAADITYIAIELRGREQGAVEGVTRYVP